MSKRKNQEAENYAGATKPLAVPARFTRSGGASAGLRVKEGPAVFLAGQMASAIALPRSAVDAVPFMSGVKGAFFGPASRTFSMAFTMAAPASK